MVMEISAPTHTTCQKATDHPTPTSAIALYETGRCASGAALGCEGYGFARYLPESMAPGSDPEVMIQCTPCYERSAQRYIRLMAGLAVLS